METKKLDLMMIEEGKGTSLEIQRDSNGDFYVEMLGQLGIGKFGRVKAQVPNPINDGGDQAIYKKLKTIYEIL